LTSLEENVRRAVEGDRRALEAVVAGVQDLVYRLALRMLGEPADAEDAAQDVLVRVVTSLASYRTASGSSGRESVSPRSCAAAAASSTRRRPAGARSRSPTRRASER
jgi:hypothetical protein